MRLFDMSLQSSILPWQWRMAKIIPLKKIGRTYRPISLLATLGKALEALVAERITYYAETYHLLPQNHFGARKRWSTVQALMVLTEQIFQAWKHRKVLSLVSFDVKGPIMG
jgi:hypothetical protein